MHSTFLDWQPRHGPWSSMSTSLHFSSLHLCRWNSSSNSSSHHPCSLNSRSTSRAASAHHFLSSSSRCFLSTSHFSSSSATCSKASSCSRSSFSHASCALFISSTCWHSSAGDSCCVDGMLVVVCGEGNKYEIFCCSPTMVFLCLIYGKFSTQTSGFSPKGEILLCRISS